MDKSRIYVDDFPERNKLPASNLSDVKHKVRKTVIISDSITKRIDMCRFNDSLENDWAVKRAFPGATASQLKYYVKASLAEDKPNTIIICAGTNNLTKKSQTVQDTAKKFIDIAKTCRQVGVKKIFISSLICRPSYQDKVDEINKLLKHHENTYDYSFIDNSNIHEGNLWKDDVHLNSDGIWKLANNYIVYLNIFSRALRPPPYSSISDI